MLPVFLNVSNQEFKQKLLHGFSCNLAEGVFVHLEDFSEAVSHLSTSRIGRGRSATWSCAQPRYHYATPSHPADPSTTASRVCEEKLD